MRAAWRHQAFQLVYFIHYDRELAIRITATVISELNATAGSPADQQGEPEPNTEDRLTGLFDELRVPLSQYLMRAGLRPEDAEEITQETFLRLFKHLLEKKREDNLRGWVFRVARNLAIDWYRGQRRLTTKSQEEWVEVSNLLRNCSPTPEEFLMDLEKIARINQAIASLSRRQLQCVYLRIEGFRHREISEALGVTAATVAESLRRAGKKLREDLSRDSL